MVALHGIAVARVACGVWFQGPRFSNFSRNLPERVLTWAGVSSMTYPSDQDKEKRGCCPLFVAAAAAALPVGSVDGVGARVWAMAGSDADYGCRGKA